MLLVVGRHTCARDLRPFQAVTRSLRPCMVTWFLNRSTTTLIITPQGIADHQDLATCVLEILPSLMHK
jgi:hypothetical protein